MHTHSTLSKQTLILILGLVAMVWTSGTAVLAGDGIAKIGALDTGNPTTFARQNPELAAEIRDIENVYQKTQYWQGFFVACGGLGTPGFSCGLASDFYDQLADKYGLPKQEVMNPAPYRNDAASQLQHYENLINNLKFKEKVCVSVGHKPLRVKKCITVSYPGSLDHYINKVPDFPGTKQLKKKVREAFDKAKSKYDAMKQSLTQAATALQKTIDELDQVQQAIDAEDQKVQRKAMDLATRQLQEAINPILSPLLESVARTAGPYVLQLDQGYLRRWLDRVLGQAKASTSSKGFETAYTALKQQVDQSIAAGDDPLMTMSFDVPASIYHLMVTCVTRPSAEAVKTCVQKSLEEELLTISEDLIHSIYTHSTQRLLYDPCSAQLADDVTTEAAEETYGLSCAAYHTLQVDIAKAMQQAGTGIYNNDVAPFVKSSVESQLRPSAADLAKKVVEPIPLPAFVFPNQNNPTERVTQCHSDQARARLSDNKCVVPLQKEYIYDWASASNTCALQYGAPLCSKDQVAEAQHGGYSYCAFSWTSTLASQGNAYRVTPMSVDAKGCPPSGLNAAVFPITEKFSGLCCVPMAQ